MGITNIALSPSKNARLEYCAPRRTFLTQEKDIRKSALIADIQTSSVIAPGRLPALENTEGKPKITAINPKPDKP